MGISKKGKRTITCHQKQYVWWVKEDEEDFGTVWLNIVSSDKMLVLSYQVGEEALFVVSKGRLFQGKETSGVWEYYYYPFQQAPPSIITPRFVQELIFWAVDGQEARKISRDYLMHTGFLYRLVLYDDELSYDNFKEGFDIGIFSSYSKAEETKKYYLEQVEGFRDYHCSGRIIKKRVLGNRGSNKVYTIYGWNENENSDEIDIIESDCFVEEAMAEQEMKIMKEQYNRTEWALSEYQINRCKWNEGFVRV